jgi:hypothetical protein
MSLLEKSSISTTDIKDRAVLIDPHILDHILEFWPGMIFTTIRECSGKIVVRHCILLLRKQSLESFLILSPVFIYLDSECQKHFFSEYFLENKPRSCSNILDFFSSFTDDDSFLRISFCIDVCLDREHREFPFFIFWSKALWCEFTHIRYDDIIGTIFYTADLYIARIWDLFSELSEELLTDHFRDTEIHRLVRVLIFIVEIWSFWELFCNCREEFIKTCFVRGVDFIIDILPKISLLEILFSFNPKDWFFAIGECLIDAFILCSLWASWINETEYEVSISESCKCLSIDESMDLVRFLTTKLFLSIMMDSWGIEEYDL